MTRNHSFFPTRADALARAAAVDPVAYARSRNFLHGNVTRLSTYITHGLISIPELLESIHARHALDWDTKLAFEFGWREYFHHVWERLASEIWREQHAPPANAYVDVLPDDIRNACTGVAIIDQQIRALYSTGYLHNHARMWIASYVVHMRKVSWRAGAAWMYSHLLDGDLASNTLSWQWVAGTWTGKPYLFNAENVSRYAPGVDCSGSVIDTSYELLDAIARNDRMIVVEVSPLALPAIEPQLLAAPPLPPVSAAAATVGAPAWLMHPWSLHLPDDREAVGVINTDFHAAYPWSEMRWRFVIDAMQARCSNVLVGSTDMLASALKGESLTAIATMNPFYNDLIRRAVANVLPAPRAFGSPSMLKRSFTSYWNQVRRERFPV